jgi:hypothetical protein
VIGAVPTLPRTPSVPKYFLVINPYSAAKAAKHAKNS